VIFKLKDRQPIFEGGNHYIAPGANVVGDVLLKDSASVWFNTVIRADNDRIEIGRESNVQDGAVLHTDTGIPLIVGDGVTIGHRVMLHGCTVGANSLIGIGSTILNHAVIGENSIVGANSLITEGKSFPPGSLLMGSPAKFIRPLSEDEKSMIFEARRSYVEKSRLYTHQLSPID
jgi:carbonic anhydrase/acetyltransferase-like protein (isoleucine patch superfamily)